MASYKSSAIIFTICALIPTIMSTVAPQPKQFFEKTIGTNLTKITWAHRTNTQAKLTTALADDKIMMLEADVIFEKLKDSDADKIAMMGHAVNDKGDLSLEKFLDDVIANNKHGIKLDFKSTEAFENGLKVLKAKKAKLTFPVWLNADIVKGPLDADVPTVDAKKFLDGAKADLPESILSIGWTTKMAGDNKTVVVYTPTEIEAMSKALTDNTVTQMITYPMRAGIVVQNTVEQLNELLKKSPKESTLTIWSDDADVVDADKLSTLIKKVGVDKVYVDVPKPLYEKLHLSSATGHLPGVFMVITMVVISSLVNIF